MKAFWSDVRAMWAEADDWFGYVLIVVMFPLLFVAFWFYRFIEPERD